MPGQRALLCKLLRQARLDNKLSQREAGELSGHDQTFISKIESGKREVDFVEVEHFARIYGKRLSFFSASSRMQ
jgi:transcriptional regulator with XRE-family HTH domain